MSLAELLPCYELMLLALIVVCGVSNMYQAEV